MIESMMFSYEIVMVKQIKPKTSCNEYLRNGPGLSREYNHSPGKRSGSLIRNMMAKRGKWLKKAKRASMMACSIVTPTRPYE